MHKILGAVLLVLSLASTALAQNKDSNKASVRVYDPRHVVFIPEVNLVGTNLILAVEFVAVQGDGSLKRDKVILNNVDVTTYDAIYLKSMTKYQDSVNSMATYAEKIAGMAILRGKMLAVDELQSGQFQFSVAAESFSRK